MDYRTSDGDILDDICTRYYGDLAWTLEAVFAANPGLAARGPRLPAGLLITLPEIADEKRAAPTIRLWS